MHQRLRVKAFLVKNFLNAYSHRGSKLLLPNSSCLYYQFPRLWKLSKNCLFSKFNPKSVQLKVWEIWWFICKNLHFYKFHNLKYRGLNKLLHPFISKFQSFERSNCFKCKIMFFQIDQKQTSFIILKIEVRNSIKFVKFNQHLDY